MGTGVAPSVLLPENLIRQNLIRQGGSKYQQLCNIRVTGRANVFRQKKGQVFG